MAHLIEIIQPWLSDKAPRHNSLFHRQEHQERSVFVSVSLFVCVFYSVFFFRIRQCCTSEPSSFEIIVVLE